MNQSQQTSLFLCLRCRRRGHLLRDCPDEPYEDPEGYDWPQSERRAQIHTDGTLYKAMGLCTRCENLDLHGLLQQEPYRHLAWEASQALAPANCDKHRRLGPVASLELRADCSLCQCLFAIMPTPKQLESVAYLLSSWTLLRLQFIRDLDSIAQMSGYGVQVVLTEPDNRVIHARSYFNAVDMLCVSQIDHKSEPISPQVREMHANGLDFDRVRRWLSLCQEYHPRTCMQSYSRVLGDIFLIDVEERLLVKHPGKPTRYIALSYVWGDSNYLGPAERKSRLEQLPSTLEDAISFVKGLGERYLWVDSVCIDQGDVRDKAHQISIMSDIYTGAYATIINLTGTSADAGLPLKPACSTSDHHQMTCKVGNYQLLSVGQALRAVGQSSVWARRAWTLQEAVLSNRCIYLSRRQVYFECNSIQCSEALDHSESFWSHTREMIESPPSSALANWLPYGLYRNPFRHLTEGPYHAIDHYRILLDEYSARALGSHSDKLNAFSGFFTSFEQTFLSQGFYWGLPVEQLSLALTWEENKLSTLHPDYPTWSWAATSESVEHEALRNFVWVPSSAPMVEIVLSIRRDDSVVTVFREPQQDESDHDKSLTTRFPRHSVVREALLSADSDIACKAICIDGTFLGFSDLRPFMELPDAQKTATSIASMQLRSQYQKDRILVKFKECIRPIINDEADDTWRVLLMACSFLRHYSELGEPDQLVVSYIVLLLQPSERERYCYFRRGALTIKCRYREPDFKRDFGAYEDSIILI